ncbi:hypothetical protein BaRGS_00020527 [Batillaria attramentaria]|uniref:Uncharacterized protein n=1 Tax=Batillaria attramentaria TaxID=370345 RepID=A0ABD0KLY0_9CAEN
MIPGATGSIRNSQYPQPGLRLIAKTDTCNRLLSLRVCVCAPERERDIMLGSVELTTCRGAPDYDWRRCNGRSYALPTRLLCQRFAQHKTVSMHA